MAHEIEPVHDAVARPIGPSGPEWSPEPQIITPVRHSQEWEWAAQLRPPAIPGTVQEKWANIATPIRAVALGILWITWHWARVAALSILLALILILIIIK